MRQALQTIFFFLATSLIPAQDLVPAWGGAMGASGSDIGTGIVLEDAGHVYTTGSFTGTTDFDPGPSVYNLTSAGSNDIYVAKFDTNGTLLWAKAMGGAYVDAATALAIDPAGNVYTTGGFCGTADFDPGAGTFNMTAATTGQNDIFVSKLDADGNFVWAKGVVGGTWWDAGYGIAIDPMGDVVVTGRFYYQGGPRDFDPGPGVFLLTAGQEDVFVLKLDADGDFVWAENFGGGSYENRGYALATDTIGNIFITGYFEGAIDFDPGPGTTLLTAVGTWNVFYLKLDTAGALVWVKSLPVTTQTYHNEGNWGAKLSTDPQGDLIATGRFSGTIDFDPGAGSVPLTAVGDHDIYVLKMDADGEFVWAKAMGGTGYDEGFGIHVGPDGNLLITGSFEGTVDFDPGPGTASLLSAGGADAFVLQLNSEGDYLHAVSFGGVEYDRGHSVTNSGSGAIYLTGWFTGTTDLDPGAGSQTFSAQGSNDIYVIKLVEANTTGIGELQTESDLGIDLFPNPANDRVNIVADPSLFGQRAVIEVFNASGTRVHTEQVNSFDALQPLALSREWVEGLYLVMVRVEGQAPKAARVVVKR